MDKLQASNLANLIGEDKIFLTVSEAVTFCSPKLAEFEAWLEIKLVKEDEANNVGIHDTNNVWRYNG